MIAGTTEAIQFNQFYMAEWEKTIERLHKRNAPENAINSAKAALQSHRDDLVECIKLYESNNLKKK